MWNTTSRLHEIFMQRNKLLITFPRWMCTTLWNCYEKRAFLWCVWIDCMCAYTPEHACLTKPFYVTRINDDKHLVLTNIMSMYVCCFLFFWSELVHNYTPCSSNLNFEVIKCFELSTNTYCATGKNKSDKAGTWIGGSVHLTPEKKTALSIRGTLACSRQKVLLHFSVNVRKTSGS